MWVALAISAAVMAMSGVAAIAGPRIVEKTEYYEISGRTGQELLREMSRKGPRHGFMTKAVAQTRFDHRFLGDMVHSGGVCRNVGGGYSLEITYIYPRPREKLSRDLARRWKVFQADNLRHEREHGRIAKAMARKLDRLVSRFSMKDGPSCRKAAARLSREVGVIADRALAEQLAFDEREHRMGGAAEKSFAVLLSRN